MASQTSASSGDRTARRAEDDSGPADRHEAPARGLDWRVGHLAEAARPTRPPPLRAATSVALTNPPMCPSWGLL